MVYKPGTVTNASCVVNLYSVCYIRAMRLNTIPTLTRAEEKRTLVGTEFAI